MRHMRHRPLILLILLLIAALLLAGMLPAQAQGGPEQPPPGMTIHVVQRGENLFRIALRYGTTVEAIAQANGIGNTAAINIGQRLLVPLLGSAGPGVPTDYVVSPADSLLRLTVRFGTTPQAIARQNFITNPARLFVGQVLALSEGSVGKEGLKTGWLYTVTRQDTLYHIAARYGVTLERLMRANGLRRASTIFPGRRLVIPGSESSPALVDLPAPFTSVDMLPALATQGNSVSFRLATSAPAQIQGTFMNRPLTLFSDEARTGHVALFGIDAMIQPGFYELSLTATGADGAQTTLTRRVLVQDGGYPRETIQLAPSQTDLLNVTVTQPEEERVRQLVSQITPQRTFEGPMGLPCPAPVTSQFGTRRSYNGGPFDRLHAGADFAAMPGAAIYAPAAGVVVLAEALNVRGNATIIDHGWGVYTGYWHQQTIGVGVGQRVEAGQIIGTVGQTGRVTGPHLHWELFVNGVQVDPLQWVRQSFP